MAYDEKLAERVRRLLAEQAQDVTERRMFGGLCFMVGGGMCCGVLGPDLIVRVGPERYAAALAKPHARVFDFSGRPSKGIVYVGPQAIRSRAALDRWLALGLERARGR